MATMWLQVTLRTMLDAPWTRISSSRGALQACLHAHHSARRARCAVLPTRSADLRARVRPARRQKTLNETAPTDEDIDEIFDFPEVKPWEIEKVTFTLDGEEVIGFGGATYAFRPDFNEFEGCKFYKVYGGQAINMWVAPPDTDTAELEEKMAEYGFHLVEYDGADADVGGGEGSENGDD